MASQVDDAQAHGVDRGRPIHVLNGGNAGNKESGPEACFCVAHSPATTV